MSLSDEPTETINQPNQSNNICQVCGDQAIIVNYGALSCAPCRTFFRRNAFHPSTSVCRYDGHCEVNILNRKICTSCRLAKCFSVDMSADLIRKEDLARKKRKRTASTKNEALNVASIPEQSAFDRPSNGNAFQLSPSDWTRISNVVHAFNAFSPVTEIRRTIQDLNTSTSNLQFDASQAIRLMSSFYHSLQSFISSTPDFRILTFSEQCSLLKRNMLGVLYIGGIYLMHESEIFNKPESESMILPFYGSEIMQQVKLICQQLNCDPVVIKLMLVALAFSSNCFMIDNVGNIDDDTLLLGTFRLLGSQNVYVETIWKYLLHTYGYNDAVQKFSQLIKQLLSVLAQSINMFKNNELHRTFMLDMIKKTKTSSTSDEQALVPLWGKT